MLDTLKNNLRQLGLLFDDSPEDAYEFGIFRVEGGIIKDRKCLLECKWSVNRMRLKNNSKNKKELFNEILKVYPNAKQHKITINIFNQTIDNLTYYIPELSELYEIGRFK